MRNTITRHNLAKSVESIFKSKSYPEGHISTYKDGSKWIKKDGQWLPYNEKAKQIAKDDKKPEKPKRKMDKHGIKRQPKEVMSKESKKQKKKELIEKHSELLKKRNRARAQSRLHDEGVLTNYLREKIARQLNSYNIFEPVSPRSGSSKSIGATTDDDGIDANAHIKFKGSVWIIDGHGLSIRTDVRYKDATENGWAKDDKILEIEKPYIDKDQKERWSIANIKDRIDRIEKMGDEYKDYLKDYKNVLMQAKIFYGVVDQIQNDNEGMAMHVLDEIKRLKENPVDPNPPEYYEKQLEKEWLDVLGVDSLDNIDEYLGIDGCDVSIDYKYNGIDVNIMDDGIEMNRRFQFNDDDELICYNDYFRIEESSEFRGSGAFIIANQAKMLADAGFDKMVVGDAAKGSRYNGYYTWAVLGFSPADQVHYDDLINNADRDAVRYGDFMPDCVGRSKSFTDFMLDCPEGREWWKKYGDAWSGEFDLSEDSKSMEHLSRYLQARLEMSRFAMTEPVQRYVGAMDKSIDSKKVEDGIDISEVEDDILNRARHIKPDLSIFKQFKPQKKPKSKPQNKENTNETKSKDKSFKQLMDSIEKDSGKQVKKSLVKSGKLHENVNAILGTIMSNRKE